MIVKETLNGEEKTVSNTPKEIELLFRNKKLDSARVIFFTYFLLGKRKFLSVEEYIFFELVYSIRNEKGKLNLKYKYFKLDEVLREILIFLSECRYIELKSNGAKTINDIKISITDNGKKLALDLNSEYFSKIRKEIMNLKACAKYTKGNYKEILKALNDNEAFKEIKKKYGI